MNRNYIVVLIVLGTVLIFYRELFEIGVIPSNSMKLYVKEGDLILIYKPLNFNIKRNDIITFYFPLKLDSIVAFNQKMIKRCIAISGDKLIVKFPKFYINESIEDNIYSIMNYYRINFYRGAYSYLKQKKSFEFLNYCFVKEIEKEIIIVNVSNEQLVSLKREKGVKEITECTKTEIYSPYNNLEFFVPKKGMKIKLNEHNLRIYRNVLEYYENNKIEYKNDRLYINGVLSNEYIFRKDYLYVLGDNRYVSYDSFDWGFLPLEKVYGKVIVRF